MILVSGSTKMPRLTALEIPVRVFRVVRGEGKPRTTPTTRTSVTRKNPEGISSFSPVLTVRAGQARSDYTGWRSKMILPQRGFIRFDKRDATRSG